MINEYIQLNDEIIMTDFEGKEFVIMKMYCNITAGKSMNYNFDILHDSGFQNNQELVKQRVAEFKATCEQRAKDAGVTIF